MRSKIVAAALVVGSMLAPASVASADSYSYHRGKADRVATYEVTITNLTEGQPFTPPLVATHRRSFDLFDVGAPASEAIQEIAENGNLDPAVALATGSRKVFDAQVVLGDVPPVLPGASRTFTITAKPGTRNLTWVSMLICSNDGFTGLDTIRLPRRIGRQTVHHTAGYDAGTEVNTETWSDLVPPCAQLTGFGDQGGTGMSNPDLAEGGVISHHPGIAGGADLDPSIHGWDNPVAKVEITRTS